MKTTFLAEQSALCAGVCLLWCTLFLLSASSCLADQAPILIEVSSATPATVSLGEPIMLHYKMSNLSATEHLAVLSGVYNTGWYTLSLKNGSGAQVALVEDTRPLNPPGFHAGDISVYATSDLRDSWQDGYIVASKSFSMPSAGKYVLTVHVHAPYALVAPTLRNPVLVKSMIKADGSAFVQDFSFPLTVTAANPAVLQAKAKTLKGLIEKEQSSTLLLPEMDELFSMPEAQAGSVWETMALEASPMNRDLIADKLGALHSSEAADILFKMIDNPASNSVFVSRRLSEIYNDGNPALREHVKSVAAQKGIQLPEQISIPLVID